VLKRFPSLKDSVKALGDLSTQTVKNKCYLLAADIAMASGDVDEAEDAMLEAMQRTLQVEDSLATKILEVLTLKYARSVVARRSGPAPRRRRPGCAGEFFRSLEEARPMQIDPKQFQVRREQQLRDEVVE
jgi:hypothetical protein